MDVGRPNQSIEKQLIFAFFSGGRLEFLRKLAFLFLGGLFWSWMILKVILEHWREKRTSFGLKKRISLTCWSSSWTLEFFSLLFSSTESSIGGNSTDFSFRSLKSCHMQRPKAAPHVAKCSDDEVGLATVFAGWDIHSMVTKMAFCFGFWVYLVMIETHLPIGRVCSMCRSKMMSMMILPRSPHGVDQQQKHAQLWESPVLSRQNWAFKKQDLVGLKGHVVTNPLIGNWDMFQSFCLSTYFLEETPRFSKNGIQFSPFSQWWDFIGYFKHETKQSTPSTSGI